MPIVVRKLAVAAQEVVEAYPDPDYVGFTAKAQRSKTRKGKDYFVVRVTIPKYAAEQINVGPEDYLVLKAKKADWYHMMDWNEMEPAWKMLPQQIRTDVIIAGLPNPDVKGLKSPTGVQLTWTHESITGNAPVTLMSSAPSMPSVNVGGQ